MSWSCLLFLLAAASISSSRTTWAVRVDPAPISNNNDSSATETANVRGGRGERGGRAFVRQPQPKGETTNSDSNNDSSNSNSNNNNNNTYTEQHDAFLTWCRDSLGIDTSLVEIDHFDYPDYLKAMEDKIDIFYEDYKYDDDDDDDDEYNNHYMDEEDRFLSVVDEYPSIKVRGLKAAQDIQVGDVVLSIPHNALWTVHNAIDASGDKNLVHSMGPEARQTNGWESPGMDEIPLLAVTLLYHMMMMNAGGGEVKNNHAPYLELLQTHNLQDSIPHLWDSRRLRKSATPSVLRVAQGIRKDVVDLYEAIVMVLIESHPDVFGIPETDEEEWMFSLEKFHWAFALINSRHWHLEIPDDPFVVVKEDEEEDITKAPHPTQSPETDAEELPVINASQEPANPPEDDHESFTDQEGPPAATPTDEWVVIQDEKLREEEERELQLNENGETANETASNDPNDTSVDEDYDYWPSGNSFLAPLADLLNFGPPCTRGTYNPVTMAFEIVATCEFQKGQEITFWYTDACEDIFVANYGFTMPMMVPKCNNKHSRTTTTTTRTSSTQKDDFLLQQQQQEQQQEYLEDELFHAYEELDRLDRRLDFLMNVLEDCHCGNQTELLEGAFDYSKSEDDDQDETDTDIDKTLLPKSPSPPTPTPTTTKKESKKGPDAQHAIRDGRSRKTKKSGDSSPEVHRHRHRHHGSMTRFRSRRNREGHEVDQEF